jgi:hypothetical protein
MGILYLIIAVLKRSKTLSWIARETEEKKNRVRKKKQWEEGGKQGEENS